MTMLIFNKKIFSERYILKISQKGNKQEPATKKFNYEIDISAHMNVMEALETERERIAVDLHDETLSGLTSFLPDFDFISREANSGVVDHRLNKMREKLIYNIDAVRRIVYGLLPKSLEMNDLNFAIRELCNKHNGGKGVEIHFQSSGNIVYLSDTIKVNIYRIIQELLTNSINHSSGWNIYVNLYWLDSEKLKVVVKDDGSGFDPLAVKDKNKLGLNGIASRVAFLNAEAKFNRPGTGTEFELIVPLKRNESISHGKGH